MFAGKSAADKSSLVRQAAREGDQRYTCADTTKLQRHFGWAPRIGLDEGLALQVEWQRASAQRAAA